MNIRIKRLDDYGRGIALVNNKVTFVPNALVGELVEYKIDYEKKNYNIARNLNVLEKSREREEAICPYYGLCGGCHIEHMSKELEERFQCEKVRNMLLRFAKVEVGDIDIVSGEDYHYRNKITLKVWNHKLCFSLEKSNDLIPIDYCFLVDEKLNHTIEVLNTFLEDEPDIQEVMLRIGNITDEVMIHIKGRVQHIQRLEMISDSLIINDNSIGKEYITSYIGTKKYHLRAESFFQVNSNMTEKMYEKIKSIIMQKKSRRVLDLYSGVGTIGIYIGDVVEHVLAVEKNSDAYHDSLENVRINHQKNVECVHGTVEEFLTKRRDINQYDTVILDPPRSGLDKKTKKWLLRQRLETIIYISCDAMTLSRDIKELKEVYLLENITLFRMFPRTYHVESVALLNLKK